MHTYHSWRKWSSSATTPLRRGGYSWDQHLGRERLNTAFPAHELATDTSDRPRDGENNEGAQTQPLRKSTELDFHARAVFMVHQTRDRDMSPGALHADGTTTVSQNYSHPYEPRTSNASRGYPSERGSFEQIHALNGGTNGSAKEGIGGSNASALSVPNGTNSYERAPSAKSAESVKPRPGATNSAAAAEPERRSGEVAKENIARPRVSEDGSLIAAVSNGSGKVPRSPSSRPAALTNGDNALPTATARSVSHGQQPSTPSSALPPVVESSPQSTLPDGMLKPPHHGTHHHRASSPPAFNPSASSTPALPRPADRLTQRHTLEVPKLAPVRTSRDGSEPTTSMDGAVVSATGRFSPSTPSRRRASLQLHRRQTRSIHSELHMDDIPQDEDAARWAEHIKQKRAKKQRQDTDDDRVVVGTKVDDTHVNYVTAYNMLTGIRFVVSRNNAKLDRELNEADFAMKQKFSFDITGNELTPSTKYDFKFKDYAPWVFRHLRSNFKIDPAEYLMSLTSKYILSELGSPGKSGSFFYFSRDYKYIIKTIHHAEHKFLRKILKDYYLHVTQNPNTLLSQFYGLHRVKLPFGRKIHFVVMNNLFPPHRDIHRTFDLKGSTIGRDFKEEDLEKNPRATLKDLNWLRRNLHLEFGPTKKEAFVAQMQKDVALLQKLKIMDYSLLVGIHDLGRGNEENLRDKTLQVFQPGGDKQDEQGSVGPHSLARTPSKMENAKRARELREMVKRQRPVPMDQTLNKMPDEAHKSSFYFYADDGGFRATHEDDFPGEEIYYLGIIDCLTRVSTSVRMRKGPLADSACSTTMSRKRSISGREWVVMNPRSHLYHQSGMGIASSNLYQELRCRVKRLKGTAFRLRRTRTP